MQQALHLAAQGVGQVAPNPSVGCVILKDAKVIGLGRTASGGRPHAETEALAMAGAEARGAIAYVTLEPCAHHGKTPPCAEALITAGITEVHIACTDPDPRVAGKGIALLEAAGIKVFLGEGEAAARWINRGFFSRLGRNRPWVTLKIATTADGFIANAEGHSKWITGEQARSYGHLLRSQNDAILTGIGTVLADDPSLNCRLAGLANLSPIRVVLDRQHQMSPTARMLQDGGAEVVMLDSQTLTAALQTLAQRGINHLMIEAGNRLNSAFLQQGLVDELYWFSAPQKHFGTGLPAFTGWEKPAQPHQTLWLGEDRLEHYNLTQHSQIQA